MAYYSAALDLNAELAAPDSCRACGAAGLAATAGSGRTSFLCTACGRCWRVELGRISRVDPHECADCQYRQECLARTAGRDPPAAGG